MNLNEASFSIVKGKLQRIRTSHIDHKSYMYWPNKIYLREINAKTTVLGLVAFGVLKDYVLKDYWGYNHN